MYICKKNTEIYIRTRFECYYCVRPSLFLIFIRTYSEQISSACEKPYFHNFSTFLTTFTALFLIQELSQSVFQFIQSKSFHFTFRKFFHFLPFFDL